MVLFQSRRSAVFARHGMVASSQSLASSHGLQILREGGNAVDAAIAMAATLNVTEPCSTGLGGDCFLLFYEAATKKVFALNGSGRSPAKLTLDRAKSESAPEATALDPSSVHCVTVPGTAAGWDDAVKRWGTMPLAKVLEPAAALAEEGFPVAGITALEWERQSVQLRPESTRCEMLVQDESGSGGARAPRAGEIFRNPGLARTLRELGAGGKDAFYKGRAGEAICRILNEMGSTMEQDDLAAHVSTFPEPIHVRYGDMDVIEVPPSGQGIAALMGLNLLAAAKRQSKGLDPETMAHGSKEHLHLLVECMRFAFADARQFVADPDVVDVPIQGLIDSSYADIQIKNFREDRAVADVKYGTPMAGSDTVSFQVIDGAGNAVSMVNSNYEGFGSGIVPKGCGFTLQNRGANFSLVSDHLNVVAPRKRPYHTIIPALALHHDTQELYCSFTNMGGFAQAPAHVQLMVNMLDYKLDPQTAIDMPRFVICAGEANGEVAFEDGFSPEVIATLEKMGHRVLKPNGKCTVTGLDRLLFGRAQIITRDRKTGVLCGGSDGRADGLAIGY
ncbi:Gamma-glutamyltranspeptidase [Hondaea fermentalgiana]|uniref:Gamma-glutamyltranspeptidase n=1 Tax=Hondaea fermentalgiana TaxID=2315210 RepID=A0A2R5H011_9STRA|nr:Gamma-glutamyltranspeptidase [Hondaea fermentalgiana]|eukprot:GBG34071.1 Gamma-glutamyltranspeptidase [Hondaea fermentalgiana]